MGDSIYDVIMELQKQMILEQHKNEFIPMAKMLKGIESALIQEGFNKEEAFRLVESTLVTLIGNSL